MSELRLNCVIFLIRIEFVGLLPSKILNGEARYFFCCFPTAHFTWLEICCKMMQLLLIREFGFCLCAEEIKTALVQPYILTVIIPQTIM
jgi:hypothetical protein